MEFILIYKERCNQLAYILLANLCNCGVRGIVYNWVESYLTNRMQYSYLLNICYICHVKYGVPQCLLLFQIYNNDIGNAVPDANVCCLLMMQMCLFLFVISIILILMLFVI